MSPLSETTLVYSFALVPAVMWGLSSVLSKRGMAAGGTVLQASVIVVTVNGVLYWAALLFRHGFDLFQGLTTTAVVTFLAAGAFGTAIGRLSVFGGVERVGANINSAVISARPLFAALLAAGFLNESISLSAAVGIGVLVAGLVVLALSRGGDASGWQTHELLFPLCGAGSFAVGNVLRRFGLQLSGVSVLEGVTINAVAAVTVLWLVVARSRRSEPLKAPRRSHLYFAGAGVVTAVSILSLFTALSLPGGNVAIVDALAATSPLFTIAFSAVFLRDLERITPGVVGGALLVVFGVGLITGGDLVVALLA